MWPYERSLRKTSLREVNMSCLIDGIVAAVLIFDDEVEAGVYVNDFKPETHDETSIVDAGDSLHLKWHL
jgi:hypothetical protein